MTFLYWIAYTLGSVCFWWVEYQDAKWSNYYVLTTTGEANWWSRGKDGYFSLKKSLLATGVYFGSVTAGAIFIPHDLSPLFGGMVLAAAGGAIWSVVHKNVKKHKKIRTEQLTILADIKKDPDNAKQYLGSATYFADNGLKTYWIFRHFYDLRVLSTFQIPEGYFEDREGKIEAARVVAEAELIPRFVALAKLPESEHFDRDRAKKV